MCAQVASDREEIGREWTREEAEMERVKHGRRCVRCKRQHEDAPPGIAYRTLETGELVCDPCLRALRRFKRDRPVVMLVDDDLGSDERLREVVGEFFPDVLDRLDATAPASRGAAEASSEPSE